MNLHEIVIHEVQRDRVGVHLNLLAEGVCEARKAAHRHPHGEVLPLDVAIPEFKGHIVIDSGEYTVIDRDGKATPYPIDNDQRMLAASVPHEVIGHQINGPAARFVGSRIHQPGGATLVFSSKASVQRASAPHAAACASAPIRFHCATGMAAGREHP